MTEVDHIDMMARKLMAEFKNQYSGHEDEGWYEIEYILLERVIDIGSLPAEEQEEEKIKIIKGMDEARFTKLYNLLHPKETSDKEKEILRIIKGMDEAALDTVYKSLQPETKTV